MTNIAVFCSGQGTNLQAIIDAVEKGKLKARMAFVLSDNEYAYALTRARRRNIPAIFIDPRQFKTRHLYERAILKELEANKVGLVVLAGFMRVLSPSFVKRYKNRIMNIHPALLPSFPGSHAVRDALKHGVKLTGVTVHFVDEWVDTGPIIFQSEVKILPDDNEETLLERIHRKEHILYPQAIQLFIDGRLKVTGRVVTVK